MSKPATISCIPGRFVLDFPAMPTDRTHMGRSNTTDRPPCWSRERKPMLVASARVSYLSARRAMAGRGACDSRSRRTQLTRRDGTWATPTLGRSDRPCRRPGWCGRSRCARSILGRSRSRGRGLAGRRRVLRGAAGWRDRARAGGPWRCWAHPNTPGRPTRAPCGRFHIDGQFIPLALLCAPAPWRLASKTFVASIGESWHRCLPRLLWAGAGLGRFRSSPEFRLHELANSCSVRLVVNP